LDIAYVSLAMFIFGAINFLPDAFIMERKPGARNQSQTAGVSF